MIQRPINEFIIGALFQPKTVSRRSRHDSELSMTPRDATQYLRLMYKPDHVTVQNVRNSWFWAMFYLQMQIQDKENSQRVIIEPSYFIAADHFN